MLVSTSITCQLHGLSSSLGISRRLWDEMHFSVRKFAGIINIPTDGADHRYELFEWLILNDGKGFGIDFGKINQPERSLFNNWCNIKSVCRHFCTNDRTPKPNYSGSHMHQKQLARNGFLRDLPTNVTTIYDYQVSGGSSACLSWSIRSLTPIRHVLHTVNVGWAYDRLMSSSVKALRTKVEFWLY